MSQDRRERQKQKQEAQQPKPFFTWRRLGIGALLLAAFGAAWSMGRHRRSSRYDALAQCMTGKGTIMYGLSWCEHCKEQEDLFGSSFDQIRYIECGISGTRDETPECKAAGVKRFPTWQFPNGERHEGGLSLQDLASKTGCSLP